MGFNALVPPTVILVPSPILVPIIIPIPLPISAFWNAYQSKKSSATPSSENDNESRHEEAPPPPEKVEENEQPLDYTTSKSPETNDNTSTLQEDNENGINSISNDRVDMATIENSSNGNNEKIPKFKITRLNIKRALDDASESSRPLRKRRIIADVDNFSESP